MSNQIEIKVEQLKSCVETLDTTKAAQLIADISGAFFTLISRDEKDLSIATIFELNSGLIGFLHKAINQRKAFKKENVTIFELFVKIIENDGDKMERYGANIFNICRKYLYSLDTSAREREKAAILMHESINRNLCQHVDFQKLLEELLKLRNKPSITATVKRRLYELMGCVCKDYPDCVDIKSRIIIRDMYFKSLEDVALKQHGVNFVEIIGAFKGFDLFLECFDPADEHKDQFTERLYKCIKKMSEPIKGKSIHRSALELLSHHCSLFATYLFDDFYYWHELLLTKLLPLQWDDRKIAISLLHAFHRGVVLQLFHPSTDITKSSTILQFLQKFFEDTLELRDCEAFKVRLAIVGIGLVASLLPTFEIRRLLHLVLQRIEGATNTINELDKEQMEFLPDYIESVSKIMSCMEPLAGIHLTMIQDIIVAIIRNFHLLSTAKHETTLSTLRRALENFAMLDDTLLDNMLEVIVMKGVCWTCTHRLPFEANSDWDKSSNWRDHITYKSFLPLWSGLIAEADQNNSVQLAIVQKTYDTLMRTLFKILDKLDLTTRKRIHRDDMGAEQELTFCDPSYDLEAVCNNDVRVFANLVNLYRDLLKSQKISSHLNYFLKWQKRFIEDIITKSIEHPFISGFMKLLRVAFQITNKLCSIDANVIDENSHMCDNVSYYLDRIIERANQNNGELQLECILLMLAIPSFLLAKYVIRMLPIFQLALDMGRSGANLFIARTALKTIERYLRRVDHTSEEANRFLKDILPQLAPYMNGFKADTPDESIATKQLRSKSTTQKAQQSSEKELLQFQKGIFLLLGKLEPAQCLYITAKEKDDMDLSKWCQSAAVFQLELNGFNVMPKLNLDSLMPRLCMLAESSTNRQTKISACELVHATIAYTVGTYNYKSKLWSKLCDLLLRLGCDNDTAVQQMFEPLNMQIIRFMSRSVMPNEPGAKILFHCLMDALSNTHSLSVRTLAARCLHELLLWTTKNWHSASGNLPYNIITLVDHLKMFSADASNEKRFGAALAFNNIYRVLREHDYIVDVYWLDLLYDFCINFMLTEQHMNICMDGQSNLTQISRSLDHFSRVLRERKQIFNRPNANRIKPLPFSGTLLKDAVTWMLDECKSDLHEYRNKMMHLVLNLAPCVDGYNSTMAFVKATKSAASLVQLCENGLSENWLVPMDERINVDELNSYLHGLDASLNCYIWCIENNFINDANDILTHGDLFDSLDHYFKVIMNKNIMELIEIDESVERIQGDQRDKLNLSKSNIFLQTLQFLNKIVSWPLADARIWASAQLVEAITTAVFQPHRLECNIKDPTYLHKLHEIIEKFIMNIDQYHQFYIRDILFKRLSDVFTETCGQLKILIELENFTDHEKIRVSDENCVKGIQLICKLNKTKRIQFSPSTSECINILAHTILYDLFNGIKEQIGERYDVKTLSPDLLHFANQMLKISFFRDDVHVYLIDLIMNMDELWLRNTSKYVKHGKQFLNLYKQTIFEYFLEKNDVAIDILVTKMTARNCQYILHILIEFIKYAYKSKAHNINQLNSLSRTLLNKWLRILAAQPNTTNILLLSTLLELMEQIAMIFPMKLVEISTILPQFDQWLLAIIRDETIYPIELKTQAILLLPCIVDSQTLENIDVQLVLEHFRSQYLPLQTTELKEASAEYTAIANAFEALLKAFGLSKSPMLLKSIIKFTMTEEKHIMQDKIIKHLKKVTRELSSNECLICLRMVFAMFTGEQVEPRFRITVLERFLKPMLRNITLETAIEFYSEHIPAIMLLCQNKWQNNMNDFKLEHAFNSKIGAMELLEQLVALVPIEHLENKSGRIAIAAGKAARDGDLMRWILRIIVLEAKEDPFQSHNSTHMEWFRKYQCAAYKACCTITCNTKTQLLQYEILLFQNPSIWNKMINTLNEQLYAIQKLDVDTRPKIKQRITSIRSLNTEPKELPRKYLESQTIFDSSLSQDVMKIDLSSSVVRQATTTMPSYQPQNISLESTSINDHEVMASLCATIKHMFEMEITPYNQDGRVRSGAPAWVNSICQIIENDQTHKNIRLFLVTVIDNLRESFAHYATRITKTILKFLISWKYEQIDATIIFLCCDLLEWDAKYRIQTEDEIRCANMLIEDLMAHAWNDNKDVFSRNLEIIRNLIEKWRNSLQIPTQLLNNSLKSSDYLKSKANICGIHLNAIVLANGLIPWNDESRIAYLQTLNSCLDSEHPIVYQPAAQVLGMALHEILIKQQSGDNQIDGFLTALTAKLDRFCLRDDSKFLKMLYGLHKHYDPIVDRFFVRIAGQIPRTCGQPKKLYLEMFLSRVNTHGDQVFKELSAIKIIELLESNEFRLLALHIVNKSLPNLIHKVDHILPVLKAIQQSSKSESRSVIYEIWTFIRQNHSPQNELYDSATAALLIGLNDTDANIRNRIYQYWTVTECPPEKIHERLLYIFERLYHPQCQHEFVTYCVQFLLEPSIQANNSKQILNILRHQNENIKLTEYKVDTAWTMQNSALQIPLFTQSQQVPIVNGTPPYLRSTESNLLFDPTQDPATMYQSTNSFSLQTHSSLLFTVPTQTLDRRSYRTKPNDINQANQTQFGRLRGYIVRDSQKARHENANRAIERIEYKRVADEQGKHRSGQVQLYRRYRFGESPDFFLNNLAFLMPLQNLIRYDAALARHTFIAIFTAIYDEVAEEDQADFGRKLAVAITALLSRSESCDPLLFSVLTEISLTHGISFDFQSNVINSICEANALTTDAILLYEQRLIKLDTTSDWASLANLNRKLSETDIVASIFANKIKTDPMLSAAIISAENGEYSRAVRILHGYLELETITQVESDFGYQLHYECYAEMARWEDLEADVRVQIDSEEDLWTNNWNKLHLLPHYMQANAHCAIHGAYQTARAFTDKIELWLRDSARCEFIEHNFSDPLMLLFIANDDFLRAKFYSDRYFEHFLTEWNKTSTLSTNLRNRKLLNLRCIAEMHDYAMLLNENIDEDTLNRLGQRWEYAQLHQTDSIQLWEMLIAYRTYITNKMLDRCQSQNNDSNIRLVERTIGMHFKLIEVAVQQDNIDLSHTVLKRIKTLIPQYELNSGKLTVQSDVADAHYMYLSTMKKRLQPFDKVKHLTDCWEKLCEIQTRYKELLDIHPDINLKIHTQIGNILLKIIDVDVNLLDENLQEQITKLTGQHKDSNTVSSIFNFARSCWTDAIGFAEQCENGRSSGLLNVGENAIGEAYYKLAVFCLQLLEEPTGDSVDSEPVFVESILKSMKFGYKNARFKFPKLLQLPNIVEQPLADIFMDEVKQIPLWNFIQWIPQLISRFRFDEPDVLDDLLLRLAECHPQAIFYAFKASYEEFNRSTGSTANRSVVQKILEAIANPSLERLVSSLKCMVLPEKVIQQAFQKILENATRMEYTQDNYLAELQTCYDNVFNNAEHAKLPKIYESFEKALKKLMTLNVLTADKEIVQILKEHIESAKKINVTVVKTDALCPWFQQYNWYGSGKFIELPGQYNASYRPNLTKPLKIVKFQRDIQVLQSLRKPIKLTVLTSDGRCHSFLIKFGEDLRTDERIQQMQMIMTDHLENDRKCSHHRLGIRTYTVVPLNSLWGIISWIDDTQPIDDFVANSMTNFPTKMRDAEEKYYRFHAVATESPIKRYSRDQVVEKMREMEDSFPHDCLRSALYKASASPEAFFALRNTFGRSLAVICIAHWILGIGDRHLRNLLIDQKTGELISVDFNMSFGGGIRLSKHPELTPFRLTKQLVNALSPLCTDGLLSKCMAHVLRKLSLERKSLVTTLEAFIREPSIDWLDRSDESDESLTGVQWMPFERVNVIAEKLKGIDPRTLLLKELESGHLKGNRIIKLYKKMLEDIPSKIVWNKAGPLRIEDQINCLIDIATDKHVLGLLYCGYRPWF